jgi:hypothetical protein
MLPGIPHILGGIDPHYAWPLPGGRYIDTQQTGVSIVGAQKGRVKHAGYIYVGHKQCLPGQQSRVFGAC